MFKRVLSSIAGASIILAACGGGASGDQAKAADELIQVMDDRGVSMDKKCVEDLAGQLSDEDAKKIVEAGPDGNPDLSPEGEALGEQIFGCMDTDSLVDQIVDEVGADNIDVDCLKDALKGGTDPDTMSAAMIDCVKID